MIEFEELTQRFSHTHLQSVYQFLASSLEGYSRIVFGKIGVHTRTKARYTLAAGPVEAGEEGGRRLGTDRKIRVIVSISINR